MNRPLLLTRPELMKPISDAITRLDAIRQAMTEGQGGIIMEGFFVLIIASFETSIIDTLKVLFTHIPGKLPLKSLTLSKENLIGGSILEASVDQYLMSLSYKNHQEIIRVFLEQVEIDEDLPQMQHNMLCEAKARRNVLLHNNLRVNKLYEENAGPLKSRQKKLSITFKYLSQVLDVVSQILNKFLTAIYGKYADYTRLKALRSLFEYFFSTPVMQFEREWIVDEQKDIISAYNSATSMRANLSGSEQTLFSLWHIQVCGMDPENDRIDFRGLGEGARQKFAYFTSALDLFKHH